MTIKPGEIKFFKVYEEDLNSLSNRVYLPVLQRLRGNSGVMKGGYEQNPQNMDFFSPLTRGIIPIDSDGRPLIDMKELWIPFQFIDSYTEQKSANYSPTNLMGRYEPVSMYSESSARQINFQLSYVALGEDDNQYASTGQRPRYETTEGAIQEIVDKWNSYLYPQYNDAAHYRRPYLALLNYGSVFRDIPVRIISLNINRDANWPEDRLTSLKRIIKVDVSFETNYSMSQVINRLDVVKNAKKAYSHNQPPVRSR